MLPLLVVKGVGSLQSVTSEKVNPRDHVDELFKKQLKRSDDHVEKDKSLCDFGGPILNRIQTLLDVEELLARVS